MRFWVAVRTSGTLWFTLAIFGLESLYISNSATFSGYFQSDYADAATSGLYPSGCVLAAMAAVKFRGFRRLHAQMPRYRSGFVVVARAFGPLILGTCLAVIAAMAVNVRGLPADPRTIAILGLTSATLTTCGIGAICVARTFPPVVAIPLSAALPFWWIAIIPTMDSPIRSHLAPDILCCHIDQQVSTTYLLSFGFLTVGLTVGLLGTLAGRDWSVRSRPVALLLSCAVITASIAVSVELTRWGGTPVPHSITEARSTPLTCDKVDNLNICVWPEQEAVIPTLAEEIRGLNVLLKRWKLPLAVGVDQRNARDGRIAIRTPWVRFASRRDLRVSVAAGYVASAAGCRQGLHGDSAADERVAALVLALGSNLDADSGFRQQTVLAAQAALAKALPDFGRWFESQIGSVECSVNS